MTTGMDRLAAAISGKISDRIPVFCNLLDQGARELGMSLQEYYSNGENVAEGQLRLREKYGYDNVWCLFYVGREAEFLGPAKISFAADGPPNVQEFPLKTPDDIPRLEVPADLTSHPAFQETLRCLRVLRKEVGGKYPICAHITASLTLPAILLGMETWMELLLSGPAPLRDELLTKCSDFFRAEIAVYREAGADLLVYENPFGSTDLLPMKLIEELSLPWMERDLGPGGIDGVVYFCASSRLNPVLPAVRARTGIAAYYLSPLDDVAEARRLIGTRPLLAGVINDVHLIEWPRERIREEVRRIVSAGIRGGPFLLGTLLMPLAIPEKNIGALLEAAFEFGRLEGGGAR
ncbi:MAG: uroporphyrinogen decarboxylase family protein [Thermoanaerobaculia bacterium]